MKLDSTMKRISKARRGYMLSPIFVEIYRAGFMFYIVEVSRGPTVLREGDDHSLTTIYKAQDVAWDLVEKLKSPNARNQVLWEEF